MPITNEVKITTHQVDPAAIERLGNRILHECDGEQSVTIEVALLAAYANVAAGLRAGSPPRDEFLARVQLFVKMVSNDACEAIRQIASMDEASVRALLLSTSDRLN